MPKKFARCNAGRAAPAQGLGFPLNQNPTSCHISPSRKSGRGIAVGHNNLTFLGGDRGGKTMAIMRSFVSSCELNKLDPFARFRDVLARIPSHSIRKLAELLPHLRPAQIG